MREPVSPLFLSLSATCVVLFANALLRRRVRNFLTNLQTVFSSIVLDVIHSSGFAVSQCKRNHHPWSASRMSLGTRPVSHSNPGRTWTPTSPSMHGPLGCPSTRRCGHQIKHGVLAVGLALAFFQYYILGVYVEIASLPSITFLNPPSAQPSQRS